MDVPDDGARGGGRGRAENRAAKIESDLTLLKWMVGSNAGLTLVVLAFLLRGHA